jgi:hypothetical protein
LISLGGRGVRVVEIIEDSWSQRRWVAVDMKTGKPVLRLHDRDLLRAICWNLGWQIVPMNSQNAQKSAPV